jgi:hypothetical protein
LDCPRHDLKFDYNRNVIKISAKSDFKSAKDELDIARVIHFKGCAEMSLLYPQLADQHVLARFAGFMLAARWGRLVLNLWSHAVLKIQDSRFKI